MQELFDCMKDAKEYGSILTVPALDFDSLRGVVGSGQWLVSSEAQMTLDAVALEAQRERVLALIDVAEVLAQKYQVVCTNPPYMGSSGMGARLSDFVKNYYPDSKSDLFAVFIERGNSMTVNNGYNCMVTMQSWMFLSSFEKMRVKILASRNITNLMHMDNMVLGIAFGTAVAVFQNNYVHGYKGTYNHIKLQDIDDGKPKEFPVTGNRFAQVSTDNFVKIPSSPVAYWVSEAVFSAYDKGILLGDISTVSEGIKTGDNNRFLRLWYEINAHNFSFALSDSGYKWYPHHKGGEFRKWYGNRDWVVNWENDGQEIKESQNSGLQGKTMYFGSFSSWSKISSKGNPMRYFSEHCLFDSGAPAISNNKILLTMALFNTKVGAYFLSIISPTLNLQVGDVKSVPLLAESVEEIEPIVEENISLSKDDWDSFETSWDFKKHPLV